MPTMSRRVQLSVLAMMVGLSACSGGSAETDASIDEVRELAFRALESATEANVAAEQALEASGGAAGEEEATSEAMASGEHAAADEHAGTDEQATTDEHTAAKEPATGNGHEAAKPGEVHWSYEGQTGPDRWSEVSAEFAACEAGKEQSPIDLNESAFDVGIEDPELHWAPSELTIIDNGHTVQANVAPGNTTMIDGVELDLIQFHFHRPSEHTMGTKAFPMELHFVHKNAEGSLAVIGVLLQIGEPNPSYDTLWSHQPGVGAEAKVENFDLSSLLPTSLRRYTYSGSLTTPPCSEGVNWNVLSTPATLSQAQANAFAYQGNARPVQGLGDRVVLADKG